MKCSGESLNRSWLLWCECRLSSAVKQVMGDIDWRNGWLLWSHLEWRELSIHMPIKNTHTHIHTLTHTWPFSPRPIKVYVRTTPASLYKCLLWCISHVFHQICPIITKADPADRDTLSGSSTCTVLWFISNVCDQVAAPLHASLNKSNMSVVFVSSIFNHITLWF